MCLKKSLLFVIFAFSNVFSLYDVISGQEIQQQGVQQYNFTHPVQTQLSKPSVRDPEEVILGEIVTGSFWKEVSRIVASASSPFASFSTNNFVHLSSNSQPKTLSPCNPEFEAAFWNEMTTRPSFPNPPVNEECFFLGLNEKTGFIMPFIGQTPLIALLKHPPAFRGSEYIDRMNGLITKGSLPYLNHVDPEGYSALMYAAEENLSEFSYHLLLKGVNVAQRSTAGETALSLAISNADQKDHVIRNMLMYYIIRGTLKGMPHWSNEFSSSLYPFTDPLFMQFHANETYNSYF